MEGGPPTGNSGYHPSWMILCIVTQLFHIYDVCFSSITYHLVDDDSCCCCTCKRDANECQPGSLSLFSLLSYKPYCTVQIHLGVLCTYILDVWEMLILFRLSFPLLYFFSVLKRDAWCCSQNTDTTQGTFLASYGSFSHTTFLRKYYPYTSVRWSLQQKPYL